MHLLEVDKANSKKQLSARHSNIRQVREKVREIVLENEEQVDRLTVWSNLGDDYSLKDIIGIAAEEIKIKRSQLLTLGRLTRTIRSNSVQTMDFLEEQLTDKMQSLNSNLTLVEALKLNLEERDSRLLEWNTEIAKLSDKVQELQYQLEVQQSRRPSESKPQSIENIPSEILYLRCKLQNTLGALNQKTTQLQQRQTLNGHLLKMLQEQSQKRISSHHNLKLLQENYRLLALENVQLKGDIDLLRIELAEYRCSSVLGGPVREEQEEQPPQPPAGVGEIPTLNLEVLLSRVEPEDNTERMPQKTAAAGSRGDELDKVHTDRNIGIKGYKHNRTILPQEQVPKSPERGSHMTRSKSTDVIMPNFEEGQPSPGKSVFENLRKWVVGARLRRKKSNRRYE